MTQGVSDYLVGHSAESMVNASWSSSFGDDRAYLDDMQYGILGGRRAESGVQVTEEIATRIASVWSAITMISNDVSRLPLRLVRESDEDGVEVLSTHKAHTAVADDPGEINPEKFWNRVVSIWLLYGNTYALIRQATERRMFLQILLPDRTDMVYDEDSQQNLVQTYTMDGEAALYFPHEVIHIEGLCVNNNQGCRFVDHLKDVLGIALAEDKYQARFFKSGGRSGGLLQIPTTRNKEARDKVERQFKAQYDRLDSAFGTITIPDVIKYIPNSVSPEQAQLVETRQETVREIARAFRLSPSKLGISDSVSFNSKSEDNRDYLDRTLSHPMSKIVAELRYKLLTRNERMRGMKFEYDVESFLAQDMNTRIQSLEVAVRSEIMTRNEARRKLRLPPSDDDSADKLTNPNINPAGAAAEFAYRSVERQTKRFLQRVADAAQSLGKWSVFAQSEDNDLGQILSGDIGILCEICGFPERAKQILDSVTRVVTGVVSSTELEEIPQAVKGLEVKCATVAKEGFLS